MSDELFALIAVILCASPLASCTFAIVARRIKKEPIAGFDMILTQFWFLALVLTIINLIKFVKVIFLPNHD